MNNSFSSNDAQEQIAAWIGMDWADSEHQVCSYDVASGQTEASTLKHSAETLRDWLAGLRKRYHGAKVAVVLEQSRGALLYALMSCDFLVLFPVNPQSLANYRKAFNPSGAKDDPGDAMLLMEMVRKHPERFRPWVPDDPQTRSLRLLVEGRRKLVNQLTRLTNQLTSHLKSYYPQALELAPALNTRGACEFLEQWPTLEALKQARPARLRKFYLKYTRSPAETIEGRIEQIKTAVALTEEEAVVLAGSMMVRVLVGQMRPLITGIDDFDDQIRRLFQKHPDRLVFESFPGAGLVLARRPAGGVWRGSGAVGVSRRSAEAFRYCAGHRKERQDVLGALAAGLSEVRQAKLSRVRWELDSVVRLGESLL
jgi:transposase